MRGPPIIFNLSFEAQGRIKGMDLKQISILVVDDVNAVRASVEDVLKKAGFKNVFTASNGEEAKRIVGTGRIHIVLCDWVMTPTDSLELLRSIRKGSAHQQRMPFIILTAEASKEIVIEAIKPASTTTSSTVYRGTC